MDGIAPVPAPQGEAPVPWDSGIHGVHREIAADDHPIIHVLAGPGTGKTYAMMRRIARLLESGVAPPRILAVSFTRTAVRDLREQLQRLRVPGADTVRAATLHSFCFGVLHEESVFKITGRTPRSLLSFEEEQLINDLAEQFGGKRKVRQLIKAYEAGWARLQRDDPGHPRSSQDQLFEAQLLDWLRYYRSMLIGELVPLTLDFLRGNPAVPVLPVLEHVLVDEYQDLNRADQVLVEELAKQGSPVVIGDDNQSIYSFRYANPEAIQTFPAEHTDCARYEIEDCRRCPPNIVAMSNALIAHNARGPRVVPLIAVGIRPEARVDIVQHPTIDDEIESIADFVAQYLTNHLAVQPGQILVLATRRFIGHGIRQALIARRLNALSYFAEDELETAAAAEGFCLLSLLVEPDDRTSLRAWIGLGQNQGGFAPGFRRVRQAAEQRTVGPKVVLDEIVAGSLQVGHTKHVVDRYRVLQERLATLRELNGLELVHALWSPDDTTAFDIRLAAENLALENPEPSALLAALVKEITQPQLPDSDSDIVRVMSLYKSKGLTANVVVVAGCVAGALPTFRTDEADPGRDAEREEQRRLFYVAITRATTALVLSSSIWMSLRDAKMSGITIRRTVSTGGGQMTQAAASPFLSELGSSAPATITTAQWRAARAF